MFWWIVLVVAVLCALAWWWRALRSTPSGPRRGVDHGSVQRTRKIDEGRANEFGPSGS